MKKVIVIVGPTAVGKTKIAIEIAKHYNLEIISGDSVAIYKRLDIGSAKPTLQEMDGINHYLIDILDPKDNYSSYDFQKMARNIIDNSNDIKIICGGTGLYISSVLFDYEFEAPRRDFDFEDKYNNLSNEELYNLLLSVDKEVDTSKIHMNNRKRVLRALEVKLNTGSSIHSFNNKSTNKYDYFIAYLTMDRELLYDRINKRVDQMINDGLIDEVKSLYDDKIYPHAIGYQELKKYFDGNITLDLAIDEIKKNTRHLAKRQETWFRNQMKSNIYNVDINNIENTINNIINDIDRWIK